MVKIINWDTASCALFGFVGAALLGAMVMVGVSLYKAGVKDGEKNVMYACQKTMDYRACEIIREFTEFKKL